MHFLSILTFTAAASAAVVERGGHVTEWKTSWGWKTKYPKTCKTVTEVSTSIEVVPTTVVKFKKEFVTITDIETVYTTKYVPKWITSTEYKEKWGWKTDTITITAPCTAVSTVWKESTAWGWNTKTITSVEKCTPVTTTITAKGWPDTVTQTNTITAKCSPITTTVSVQGKGWTNTVTDTITAKCSPITTTVSVQGKGWTNTVTDTITAKCSPITTTVSVQGKGWTNTVTDTITTALPATKCSPVTSVSTCTVSVTWTPLAATATP